MSPRISVSPRPGRRLAGAVITGLLLVLLSSCSGEQRAASQLIKALDDTQSDLRSARLVLAQHAAGRTITTTAQVTVKYARDDAASAQREIAVLSGGTGELRDQQQVAAALEDGSAALRQADFALRGQADDARSMTVLDEAIERVAGTRRELVGR